MPLPISVVIPAYQAAAFLPATLAAIAAQTAPVAEVIVVDDASTDATARMATEAGARTLIQPRNAGPSAARNVGVDRAEQPWIAFCDADDRWHPEKLARQWAAIERWPTAGFCITDYTALYPDGRVVVGEMAAEPGYAELDGERADGALLVGAETFARGLLRSMFVRQSSAVVRREALLAAGGFDPALRLCEDYDLFLRLLRHVPAAAIVEESLVDYPRRGGSLSSDPLAERRSIVDFLAAVAGAPDRYPAAAAAAAGDERRRRLAEAALTALRLGRFGAAEPFERDLRAAGDRRAGWLAAARRALDTPVGQRAHAALRSAWRARPKVA